MNICSFFLDVCICPQIPLILNFGWYYLLNCYTSVLVQLLFVFICGMQVFSPKGHNESIIYRNHVSHTTSAFFPADNNESGRLCLAYEYARATGEI